MSLWVQLIDNLLMNSSDWLILNKKVRFGDCDSGAVIHFHNLLRWAHESWEESLEIYGISHSDIFPSNITDTKIIFPIVNCEASFYMPIRLGDLLSIRVLPSKINNHLFQVKTIFSIGDSKVADGKLIHCSIEPFSRNKVNLPDHLELWIEASNIQNIVEEC